MTHNAPVIRILAQQELNIIAAQIATLEHEWDILDSRGTQHAEQNKLSVQLNALHEKRAGLIALLAD